MGYGLMVYAADFQKLKGAFGSGDDKIRRAISGRFREYIVSTNDQLGYSNERGEPSIFEAVRHLIMGDEKNLPGAMYGYAYEYIVRFYGKFLDNGCFIPCSYDYLQEVDRDLHKLGVTLELMSLAYGGALIPFPRPDDFPSYGYWTPEAIQENLPILQAHDTKTKEEQAVQSWLEYAAPRGEGILGFWY